MTPSPLPMPMPKSILLVEDDAKIADMLANYLQMHAFDVTLCTHGDDAVHRIRQQPPALVLLDLMIPGLDGLGVCRAVRKFSNVPIIMVTARVDEIDRLLGLDTGADDYICKPFSPREVVARVKALLRRAHSGLHAPTDAPSNSARFFQMHAARQQIDWSGQALPLTAVEYRLLRELLLRPGEVFGRARLLECLHDDWRDVSDRTIDSHIKNLRRKLEQAGASDTTIASVYGVGYRLETERREP